MDALYKLLDITVDTSPDNEVGQGRNGGRQKEIPPGADYEAETRDSVFIGDTGFPLGQMHERSPEVTSRVGSDSNDSVFTITDDDFRTVEEYRGIVTLYRELPRDMCVAQIVQNFGSSEHDLENVRDLYFEHLKNSCEDFPFGENVSLKRRMFTRTGEPVAIRLAQDIYNIVEVTEGGDPAILRNMISAGQRGKRVSVACGRKRQLGQRYSSPAGKTSGKCSCSSELKLLKDTVSTLQADVLMLKQTMHMAEKLKNEQSEQFRTGLLDIKKCILTCSSSLSDYTGNTVASMRNISHSVMQQIIGIEDRVRLLEAVVECQAQCTDTSSGTYMDAGGTYDDAHNNSVFLARELPEAAEDQRGDASDNSADQSGYNSGGEHRCVQDQRTCPGGDREQLVGAAIPVRITDRGETDRIQRDTEGFTVHRRKKTNRYCVLGLSSHVNVKLLSQVIRAKGPTVTNIRVFPCRRDRSKVVLRLNVMADSYSERVMDADFWPHYVSCRPWNTHNSARRREDRRELPPRFHVASQGYTRQDFDSTNSQGGFIDVNRYGSLISDVD